MVPYHPHPSDRAFVERQAHMLRIVGDYGRLVGHRLVAEDQHRAAVAFAERERGITEAGLRGPGVRPSILSLRQVMGTIVIRVGERLRGAPMSASTPAEVPLA